MRGGLRYEKHEKLFRIAGRAVAIDDEISGQRIMSLISVFEKFD